MLCASTASASHQRDEARSKILSGRARAAASSATALNKESASRSVLRGAVLMSVARRTMRFSCSRTREPSEQLYAEHCPRAATNSGGARAQVNLDLT